MKGGSILLAVVALGVGIAFGPQLAQRLPAPVANWLDRLGSDQDVIAVLVTSTQKMNELTVFGAQLFSIVKTEREGLIAPLDTTTYVIVPGSVRYVVNLSTIDRRNFNWDAGTGTLVVLVADPVPTDANIDGARAKVLVDGIDLAGGDERERILQKSLAVARDDIGKKAREAFFMAAAKDAARAALVQNFAAPLRATGLKPTVIIRFGGDPALPAPTKG
jgi:hypothetical protein